MFNWRLYRVTFLPVALALAVGAFSLSARPSSPTSTLAPDAFDGAAAFAELHSLAAEFPDRRPGSAGDDALAAHIRQQLEGLGGTAGGGFTVHTRHLRAQTIDGERNLATVIAQRPGSSEATPIVIVAHRDAAARGSEAELSASAALIELARVFAARETDRTIVLLSTSGGSGGDAGAEDFAARPLAQLGPLDATIVLGDLAGTHERKPAVVPYSDGFGSAPLQLQRTVAEAITQQTGSGPGAPSVFAQLAHLSFPLAVGEQGVFDAHGIPAVLVQVSGERGPSPREPVSLARMEGFGRAVLSAVDALDTAPDISASMQTGVLVQHQSVPAWAVRLLGAALLLGPLLLAADGYARLRRRSEPVGRWTVWTLSCALPFFAVAVFARVLGWMGALTAAPSLPVLPTALPFDGAAASAVIAAALVLVLAWLAWPKFVRRVGLRARPDADAAGLSLLVVLLAVCLLVLILNPFAALLLLGALHLWLLIISPELRPRPVTSLALVALALAPLALLIAFYAEELGLGPAGVAWTAMLLLAGGHVTLAASALWSLAFGCAAAAAMLACLTPGPGLPSRADGPDDEITIRGPISYAGPGSLGGTESALRR